MTQKIGYGLAAAGGVTVIAAAAPLVMGFTATGIAGGSIAASL